MTIGHERGQESPAASMVSHWTGSELHGAGLATQEAGWRFTENTSAQVLPREAQIHPAPEQGTGTCPLKAPWEAIG